MAVSLSIITICFNAEKTIERCIRSVISQTYPNVEYIVIDGASQDGTWQVIDSFTSGISHKISEPDKGLYDAINKGIKRASGEVVGLIHADDWLAADDVLEEIARAFGANPSLDAVYGNLDFYTPAGKVVRRWRAGPYQRSKLARGWMPAHPTFYVRRKYFAQYGLYDDAFGSAADYELMLRFLYTHQLKARFINRVLVNMQTGGISNRSFKNRLRANLADLRAMQKHGVKRAPLILLLKILRKIMQLRPAW